MFEKNIQKKLALILKKWDENHFFNEEEVLTSEHSYYSNQWQFGVDYGSDVDDEDVDVDDEYF